MRSNKKSFERAALLIFLLVTDLFMLAACSPETSAGSSEQNMEGMVGDEMEGMDHEHMSDEAEGAPASGNEQVSNDDQGAKIRLISPEDGATYFVDEEIPVEVEIEGFALGEEGGHWHVSIDGTVWAMTTGSETQQVILGLEPGMRKIEVSLAGGDHVDLASSDAVTIAIEKRE